MKKLLITTALVMLAAPAYAKNCGTGGGTGSGGPAAQNTADAALFNFYDGSCSSDNQANDGDDLKGFLDKGKPNVITGPNIDLSLTKNSSLLADQNTVFKDLSAGDSTGFTDGNGFANIKSTGDALQKWEFDPIPSSVFGKLLDKFVDFDGILFRGQFADFVAPGPAAAAPAAKDEASFTLEVHLSDGTVVSDTFSGLKLNADDGVFGFDEVGTLPAGVSVDFVDAFTDGTHSWDQVKQIEFSVGGAVAAVPEPSTWAMGIIGFGFVGLMGLRGRKGLAATVPAKAS